MVCFLHFDFQTVLRATTADTFLLFDPPEPQIIGKTVFRDFPTFSRICICCLLTLSLLWSSLFYSPLLSASAQLCFSSVHIVGSLTSKLPSIMFIYFCVFVNFIYLCLFLYSFCFCLYIYIYIVFFLCLYLYSIYIYVYFWYIYIYMSIFVYYCVNSKKIISVIYVFWFIFVYKYFCLFMYDFYVFYMYWYIDILHIFPETNVSLSLYVWNAYIPRNTCLPISTCLNCKYSPKQMWAYLYMSDMHILSYIPRNKWVPISTCLKCKNSPKQRWA
jgi:hypothetical protein